LVASEGEASDQVRNILFDLMKRETANFSADFSNVLVRKLKSTVTLSRDPQRSAAFKVLKQTHAPSVLVELGYLSHLEDEKLLNTPQWQKQTAASIATAVDAYFAKRTVSTP
jgi:N-acetylmuramoyl-L-alanine amidase